MPYLISIQPLKQINNLLKEISNLFLRGIPLITFGINGINASTMLAPLMRPERLVVPIDINPVLIHVVEEVVAALRLQNIRDIGVCTGRVTA